MRLNFNGNTSELEELFWNLLPKYVRRIKNGRKQINTHAFNLMMEGLRGDYTELLELPEEEQYSILISYMIDLKENNKT